MHANPAGRELIADILARELRAQGVLAALRRGASARVTNLATTLAIGAEALARAAAAVAAARCGRRSAALPDAGAGRARGSRISAPAASPGWRSSASRRRACCRWCCGGCAALRILSLIGHGTSDYLGPLGAARDPAALVAIGRRLRARGAPLRSRRSARACTPTTAQRAALARGLGGGARERVYERCPLVRIEGSWERVSEDALEHQRKNVKQSRAPPRRPGEVVDRERAGDARGSSRSSSKSSARAGSGSRASRRCAIRGDGRSFASCCSPARAPRALDLPREGARLGLRDRAARRRAPATTTFRASARTSRASATCCCSRCCGTASRRASPSSTSCRATRPTSRMGECRAHGASARRSRRRLARSSRARRRAGPLVARALTAVARLRTRWSAEAATASGE